MIRQVFHVVHASADGRWFIEAEGGELVGGATLKSEAVQIGRSHCLDIQESGGLAQLIVHRQDGSIETEYTYDDPGRTMG